MQAARSWVSSEICSTRLEWRDRDCHFIFGNVCTAAVIKPAEDAKGARFNILSMRCATQSSNNIRNNNGCLRRSRGQMEGSRDMQFVQEGRKVFKKVLPLVSAHIQAHLEEAGIQANALKCLWLYQSNKSMNGFIGRKVLGRTPTAEEQSNILQDYADTSSAGSIIVLSHFSGGLKPGDFGLICSLGAGYSVGCVIVQRSEA